MFPAGVITFREVFETTLVVGIIFSYLTRTNQIYFKKFVWLGVVVGIAFSLLFAFLLHLFLGGLKEGRSEQIIEGTLMFITAGFLTWMIVWVHRQKEHAAKIQQKLVCHIENKFHFGIFLLALTSVMREGTETVLYLQATSLAGAHNQFIGALFGILIALFLGFLVFALTVRVKLKTIFLVTSIFLLLFAAGLVASGVHEFQEAGIIPLFPFDPLFNISKFLNEEVGLGSMLHSLFGYTSRPSMFELSSYLGYILSILALWKVTDKLLAKKSAKA